MIVPGRILVVQPSWVGDAVMATPALRALRAAFPLAHISYLLKRQVRGMYAGMPWADRLLTFRVGTGESTGVTELASRVRSGKFDLAILLTNSFRSALVCRLAGIPRIVGYARDGRSILLTDRIAPVREGGLFNGSFKPVPIVGSYLKLVEHVGAIATDRRLELFVTPRDQQHAFRVLKAAGIDTDIDNHNVGKPLIFLNPGAQYGAAKCWLPEYFAEIADRCVDELGATVLVSGSPKERPIVDAIRTHAKRSFVDLVALRPTLGSLKELVRRSDLMLTNDTGPRHIAAAMQTPVVTLFGPTHQDWTRIDFPHERSFQIPVECGPCQKKICPLAPPLYHQCMKLLTPDMVWPAMLELLRADAPRRVSLPVRELLE